jgi:hypothetical protein
MSGYDPTRTARCGPHHPPQSLENVCTRLSPPRPHATAFRHGCLALRSKTAA